MKRDQWPARIFNQYVSNIERNEMNKCIECRIKVMDNNKTREREKGVPNSGEGSFPEGGSNTVTFEQGRKEARKLAAWRPVEREPRRKEERHV